MSHLKHAATSALSVLAAMAALTGTPERAEAGVEPYLGDVMIVGFNFCPRGWTPAEGQLMPISGNQALFALFGTQYGGDGKTTFAFPDLRGRLTVGQGVGPGLSERPQGQKGGAESQTMTIATMPAHSHMVYATNADGDLPGPGGKLLAAAPTGGTGDETIYSDLPANKTMATTMIGNTGGGQPFGISDPSLGLTHCIAIQGIFPPRN